MIYLLTYDHPHRKTQDLLYQFKVVGVDLCVLIFPWQERKNFKPLFQIKPDPIPWKPDVISEELGFKFEKVNTELFKESGKVFAIAGAGILPGEFAKNNTIVNAHCGWLPKVRGLDALKWAIYHGHPIGVTTHVIDEKCDGGLLIERREVPLYPQDTLYQIAIRQYEMEIAAMVDAIGWEMYMDAKPFEEPAYEPHRRMKHSTELVMIDRLKERLRKLPMEAG